MISLHSSASFIFTFPRSTFANWSTDSILYSFYLRYSLMNDDVFITKTKLSLSALKMFKLILFFLYSNTYKSFLNLIDLNQIWIVITLFPNLINCIPKIIINFKLYIIDCNLIFLVSKFCFYLYSNTQKSFLNLVDLNQIWIVITLFGLIRHQIKFRLVPNQSEN